ncbi:peptidoglycan bridge formation glycyltransferase FemA/FemB family protein [Candidatus Saccharibacteria bacterium]|nr:peptidoglycan bridge formation glycyltransferase FemA/FemB family protein [Candidatus Saccharibacteria bacterium]
MVKNPMLDSWDQNLQKFHPEANFLQSSLWYKTNEAIGHTPKIFSLTLETGREECQALCLVKSAKRGRYLEVPGGPLLDWRNDRAVEQMFDVIKTLARASKCGFVRLRPQLKNTPENRARLKSLGLKPSPMHLHAEHTIIIDLRKSEDELLANMRRQTRYEVRRADKLKLKVDSLSANQKSFKDLLEEFYQTQQKTAARQHFIPPSKKELEAECTAFGKNATLYVAKTDQGEPVAYGLILKWGDEADYFEAASTDLNRKLPGAYALLWQAMKDLKAEGYARFNLWGIAPPGQPNHRYAKVTTFKTGFGGEVVNFVPAHDLVVSRLKYLPDFFVETARRRVRRLG